MTTQTRRPWRTVVRTAFQAVVGLSPVLPSAYQAATQQDPTTATGWVGVGLTVSVGITRVMALPGVEAWLRTYLPWLAADTDPATPTGQPAGEYEAERTE